MCSGKVVPAQKWSIGHEIRLVVLVAGLYGSFLVWGYLQEKITSTAYISDRDGSEQHWDYAAVLNSECTITLLEFIV